jgi:para-aminobenzoate synthetase
MSGGHILFIDAYDSFSNNIIALLKEELSVSVEGIKINDPRFVLNDDAFHNYLQEFDAVVAGPGPGHPENASDVGLIGQLWNLPDDNLIPVLGICLGFQSLALALGGTVERLREPRHGMVTPVVHCDRDIFNKTGEIAATHYHSLHVTAWNHVERMNVRNLWRPTKSCKEMLPLAWDLSDGRNGPILMALRHCHKPFWGVQYHPESICTNEEGKRLIVNWWRHACAWRTAHNRVSVGMRHCLSPRGATPTDPARFGKSSSTNTVQWKAFQLQSGVDIVDIANLYRMGCDQVQPVLLESGLRNGRPVNAETGRFSIVGIPDAQSIHIRYSVVDAKLTITIASMIIATWNGTIRDTFAFLESWMDTHNATRGAEDVPFWGGLVGFMTYEAGLESIDVELAGVTEDRPDMWFVFIQRSIVVDHIAGTVYVQSIRDGDLPWLCSAEQRVLQLTQAKLPVSTNLDNGHAAGHVVSSPGEAEYCHKVKTCQDHLRAGSSYELCLTDATLIRSESDPWPLYSRLRHLNPAPFGAYFSLTATSPDHISTAHSLNFVSSSPERFLSWSRGGRCQFRPIKGTVKKGPGMTRKEAERILSSPKEQAENLMIVDLIRHDLNGVKR